MQSSLSSLSVKEGYDAPESSMEALYQAAAGLGYDQNCNNSYDGTTDVRPFIPLTGPPINDETAPPHDASQTCRRWLARQEAGLNAPTPLASFVVLPPPPPYLRTMHTLAILYAVCIPGT